MIDARSHAAAGLLGEMLSGIQHPAHRGAENVPTLALDEITAKGTAVTTVLIRPSGDTFRITVEWLADESP